MRWIPSIVAAALLLLLIAVVADLVLTDLAEEQAAERVSAELGAPADVRLSGWPVSVRLLLGTVPRVGITAEDIPIEGTAVRLTELDVDVTDVRLEVADLLGDGPLPVDGGSGTFRAALSEEQVNRLAEVGEVQLGEGVASLVVLGQRIDAVATVEDDQIVLRPLTDVPGLGPIPLAPVELPGEVRLEAVRILSGQLELTGRVLRLVRR